MHVGHLICFSRSAPGMGRSGWSNSRCLSLGDYFLCGTI